VAADSGCAPYSSNTLSPERLHSSLCFDVTTPEAIQRFRSAMQSPVPAKALPELAISFRDDGMSKADLYALFQKFQEETSPDDPRYDAIVDTMDLIHGGPWAKGADLYPESP